ncbi:hypothetical protein P9112_011143 [Eukaryota sp. TZLM1-RC]
MSTNRRRSVSKTPPKTVGSPSVSTHSSPSLTSKSLSRSFSPVDLEHARSSLSELQSLLKKQKLKTSAIRDRLTKTATPLRSLETTHCEDSLNSISTLLSKYNPSFVSPNYTLTSPLRTPSCPSPSQSLPSSSSPVSGQMDSLSLPPIPSSQPDCPKSNNEFEPIESPKRRFSTNSFQPSYDELVSFCNGLECENTRLKQKMTQMANNHSESNQNQNKLLKATLTELSSLMDRIQYLEKELKRSSGSNVHSPC